MPFPDAFAAMMGGKTLQVSVMRRSGVSWAKVRIENGVLQKQMKWNGKWLPYDLGINTAILRTWRDPRDANEQS